MMWLPLTEFQYEEMSQPKVLTLTERAQPMSPDEHHHLVAEWCPEDPLHYVEHPAVCRYLNRHGDTTCGVGWTLDSHGLEDLHPLPEVDGRWRIEYWHETIHGWDFAVEHDAGIRWVDEPGAAT